MRAREIILKDIKEKTKKDLGNWGEDLASLVLSNMGYKILMRNVTFKRGELDIVAIDDDELVIIEVRVRTNGKVQSPIESVGPRKIKALIRSGRLLIEQLKWEGPWRIDILGITLDASNADGYDLEYVKDVTLGMI